MSGTNCANGKLAMRIRNKKLRCLEAYAEPKYCHRRSDSLALSEDFQDKIFRNPRRRKPPKPLLFDIEEQICP